VNTVPGEVKFSLDVRARTDEVLGKVEAEMKAEFEKLRQGEALVEGEVRSQKADCEIEWKDDFRSPAVHFNKECIDCVEESCAEIFGSKTSSLISPMVSGAGKFSHIGVCTAVPCQTPYLPLSTEYRVIRKRGKS
jgi:acetylornithine deacetylase/succinyl-diaminopimelate desuccinylase-like protein